MIQNHNRQVRYDSDYATLLIRLKGEKMSWFQFFVNDWRKWRVKRLGEKMRYLTALTKVYVSGWGQELPKDARKALASLGRKRDKHLQKLALVGEKPSGRMVFFRKEVFVAFACFVVIPALVAVGIFLSINFASFGTKTEEKRDQTLLNPAPDRKVLMEVVTEPEHFQDRIYVMRAKYDDNTIRLVFVNYTTEWIGACKEPFQKGKKVEVEVKHLRANDWWQAPVEYDGVSRFILWATSKCK